MGNVLKDARDAVELIDAVGTRLGIVARPQCDAEVETALARLGDGSEILHARRVSA